MLRSGFRKLVALCLLVIGASLTTSVMARWSDSFIRHDFRPVVSQQVTKSSSGEVQKLRLLSAYEKLPMTFESNQGQTAKQVKFVSRGPGYSLFLTSTEAVIALNQNSAESKPSAKSSPIASNERKPGKTGYSVLRISLDGAAKSPAVTGLDPLPGTVNYFIGKDAKNWHTNLPTYSR
jgi:hypothetical protein